MKILHIDTGAEWRGGQRQAKILHEALLASGIESHFLANKRGALYEKLKNTNKTALDYRSELSIKTHRQVADVISKIKPDIIHTHDGHAVIFGAWHKTKNTKLVETRRVSYPISLLSRHVKYAKVDRHVAVSQDIANYLNQYFKNVSVIHSCIQNSRFTQASSASPLPKISGIKDILFVGAFSTQKGIDVLIKAFAQLLESQQNARLHLVGDGKLLEAMKQLAGQLGISAMTTFHGKRNDIEGFYQHADLVIVPSVDGEGSSGVIKEGMAAGKVVIASDLAANKELVENGRDAILFQSTNHLDLSEKMAQVISGDKVLGEQNILTKAASFDCKILVENYLNLYQEMLSKK